MANTPRQMTIMSGTKTTGTTNGTAFGMPAGTIGALFIINLTASVAPTTLDVKIQFQDPVSLGWADLKDSAQASTAAFAQLGAVGTGTSYFNVAPALTTTANKAFNQLMPPVIRAVATVVGTSYTFTVSVQPVYSK